MRSIGLCALLLAAIPTFGCGDDIKFPDEVDPNLPDPALNGVNPPSGFTNRTITVQISGDQTEFSDVATVDFGTGVTVDELTLASPSLLVATITIAGTATLGAHDVVVTDGDNSHTLTGAFEVQDPVEVFTVGALLQGGFAQVLLVNRDSENPWLGDIQISAGNGVGFDLVFPLDVTEYAITAFATFDTDAVTGQVVVEDTLGNTTVTSQGGDVPVTARTATPLAPPTGKKSSADLFATATMNGTTELFSFTGTSALTVADVFSTDKNGGEPFFVWLENGKWATARRTAFGTNFTSFDLVPTDGTTPVFLLIIDNNGLTGFTFDIEVSEFLPLPNVSNLNEVEPNDDATEAQTGTGGEILFKGTLIDFFDLDFVKVTVAAGERIRVVTTTGSTGFANTALTIFDDQDVVVAGPRNSNTQFGGNEDLTSPPLLAGDYFILMETFDFLTDNDPYEAAIVILPAVNLP